MGANELHPGREGGGAYLPLRLSYSHSVSTNIVMSQLDKLLDIAANENKLIRHELEIGGHDLTFWSRPLTIAEYQAAKRASKDPDDLLETTVRLFIKKALDESGRPQYQADALPVLMRNLSMETASTLMGAMNDNKEEEAEEMDFKSAEKTAEQKSVTSG